jgi:hypothetical protein
VYGVHAVAGAILPQLVLLGISAAGLRLKDIGCGRYGHYAVHISRLQKTGHYNAGALYGIFIPKMYKPKIAVDFDIFYGA